MRPYHIMRYLNSLASALSLSLNRKMQIIELERDKPYFRSVSLIAKVFIIQFLTGLLYMLRSDNWAINLSLLKSACSKLENHLPF